MSTGRVPPGVSINLFDVSVDHPRVSLRLKPQSLSQWTRPCKVSTSKDDQDRVVNVLSLSHEAVQLCIERLELSAVGHTRTHHVGEFILSYDSCVYDFRVVRSWSSFASTGWFTHTTITTCEEFLPHDFLRMAVGECHWTRFCV